MSKNELGIFLRERRGNKSLRSFSKELGISHTHLDSIEKGFDPRSKKAVNIGVETINKLSEKLGVSSATLLNMVSGTDYRKALDLENAQNLLYDEIKRNPQITEEEKDELFIKFMNEYGDNDSNLINTETRRAEDQNIKEFKKNAIKLGAQYVFVDTDEPFTKEDVLKFTSDLLEVVDEQNKKKDNKE